jgi:hypothetical protein
MSVMASWTKPIVRTVHAKPWLGSIWAAMAEKTMPPVADPMVMSPRARALYLSKYVPARATVGAKTDPKPTPTHTAWERKMCQYSVERLSMNMPRMYRRLPPAKTTR